MSDTATLADTLRKADLPTLAAALNDQRTRSVDLVAPAGSITFGGGNLIVTEADPMISEDGVTEVNGLYLPTRVAHEGISSKLKIPGEYLARCLGINMWTDDENLFDVNVNAWLRNQPRGTKYLLRLLKRPDGEPGTDGADGVMRAMLSDRFRCIDNFDVLLAALRGMADAGITDPMIEADLTERRMVVRVHVPQIAVQAPKLLEGYRSPWGGQDVGGHWTPERVARASEGEGQGVEGGGQTVFAGFVISNSETGGSAFNLTPRLVVKVCNNGLTITAEALRRVHLGAQLDDGTIQWSEATTQKNLALVASQTSDAVRKFITPEFVAEQIEKIEADAATPIEDAQKVIETVSKKLGFTDAERVSILDHFVRGGQMTAGGVMQAVTSAAQLQPDGDAAWDMELKGVDAMHEAVAAMRTLAKV